MTEIKCQIWRDVSSHLTLTIQDLQELADNGDSYAATCSAYLKKCEIMVKDQTKNQSGTSMEFEIDDVLIVKANVTREIAWERLHTGRWDAVPCQFREVYGVTTLLSVMKVLLVDSFVNSIHESLEMKQVLYNLDMVLMMGGERSHKIAHQLFALNTQQRMKQNKDGGDFYHHDRQVLNSSEFHRKKFFKSKNTTNYELIERVDNISLESFLLNHMNMLKPVIITGVVDHWPACASGEHCWKNMNYLRKVAGNRTVPIEIVKSKYKNYLDESFTQKLLDMDTFISEFIESSRDNQSSSSSSSPLHTGGFGYLAQHQLFDQIPELRNDISTPDYCHLFRQDELEVGNDVSLNAWFGPKHTVSPLHFDPKHNLLSQVVGRKYICCFSHRDSQYLYPHDGLMSNNSSVDFDSMFLDDDGDGDGGDNDKVHCPLFERAKGYECELQAGEMLYIPPLCWHYVKSEEVSFSVSFWWGKAWDSLSPPSMIQPSTQPVIQKKEEGEKEQAREGTSNTSNDACNDTGSESPQKRSKRHHRPRAELVLPLPRKTSY